MTVANLRIVYSVPQSRIVYSEPQAGSASVLAITSASTRNNNEGSTLAHALTANKTVTWSIVGGADQSKFELSGATLRWAGNGTKDYEAPDDADANNTYVVQVRGTDLASNVANQTITVTVLNVSEGGFIPSMDFSDARNSGYFPVIGF